MFKQFFIFFLLLIGFSYGFDYQLEGKVKVHGAVSDIVYSKGKLYVSTERGKVDIIDLKSKQIEKSIEYPKFLDFMGEPQLPKVFSADVSPDGRFLLAVIQGNRGGREVYILNLSKDEKPKKIISRKKHWQIGKLRFIDNSRVVFGLSGDEVILYDLKKEKDVYRLSVGMSFFSDMALDNSKRLLAVADESGDVHIVNVLEGKVIKTIEEMNKDKSFSVDIKNNIVITGGRDKKATVYNLKTGFKKEFLSKDFMVFSVALSSSGKIGAYVYNDKYDVAIIDISAGEIVGFLKGHTSTPSRILFIDENLIITGCDNGEINIWRIKK